MSGKRRFYPSASKFEVWLRCPARALAITVHGFKEAFGKSAQEGTRLHKVTQQMMTSGKVPGAEERAVHKIIGALPLPIGTYEPENVERVLVLPDIHGFMDWTDDLTGRQGDLKFTSNVRYQREKNPTEDPQRVFYAMDHFHRDPSSVAKLRQTWSVSQFDGSRAIRLDHVWTMREVRQAFSKNFAKELDDFKEAVHKRQDWQTAKKNPGDCWKFPPNGCPMLKHGCKRSLTNDNLTTLKPGKIRISP